jgi:predicted ATP-grasp superfamily ATP-dependent carboligase
MDIDSTQSFSFLDFLRRRRFSTRAENKPMSASPKILIVGLESWAGVARLPHALQDAGFEVGVACFEDDYLAATRFRDRFFPWRPRCRRGGALLRQLAAITHEWRPDFLVPADDPTVAFLARGFERLSLQSPLASLLKFSLGNPAALWEAASKHGVLERAQRCGVRVPHSRVVASEAEMLGFARETGFPFLLKQSFSWAGIGVAICRNESEAVAVWKNWHRKLSWKRRFYAWRNRIRGRELSAHWLPADRVIVASQFITGKPVFCQLTVLAGRVLAGLTALKEKTYPDAKSPSSVVRLERYPEMRLAAEKLAGAWELSGFIGFDFILDPQGNSWLIECNPRPTSIAHLGGRVGEDICLALHHQLAGLPPLAMQQKGTLFVAHYPHETMRDPASPYLTAAIHDVPWDDPGLLRRLSEGYKVQLPIG